MSELTDGDVRNIAAEWHGGQWSPLYALASTGAIVDGLEDEIAADIAEAHAQNMPGEATLLELVRLYAAEHGARGPVAGWSELGRRRKKWSDTRGMDPGLFS